MEKTFNEYQFDLDNGISVKVKSTSFSRAINEFWKAFPAQITNIKCIYNLTKYAY